jgi:FkbM family methyltransferase
MVVYDIGAHSGYYSLLAARCIGTTGRVIAFEPLPENQAALARHLKLNQFSQVTIIPAAVARQAGSRNFKIGSDRYQGRLAEGGELEVRVISLDAEIDAGFLPVPDLIKIDTEGAEFQVLEGARQMLERRRPTLFVSVHSPENRRACQDLLLSLDYRLNLIWNGQPETELDFIAYG